MFHIKGLKFFYFRLLQKPFVALSRCSESFSKPSSNYLYTSIQPVERRDYLFEAILRMKKLFANGFI